MNSTRTFRLSGALILLAFCAPSAAFAEGGPRAAIQKIISTNLGLPDAKVMTEAGDLESKLDGCSAPKAFLPYPLNSTGGRTSVGFHCEQEGEAPRYVPVNIRVMGSYWVPSSEIPRGSVVSGSMLLEKTGDLSKLPRNFVSNGAEIIGQQANRTLKPNVVIQKSALQAVFAVKRNAPVDVHATGPGFTVKRDGVAMDNGAIGSSIRVKMTGGEIIRAVVTGQNVLKIDI